MDTDIKTLTFLLKKTDVSKANRQSQNTSTGLKQMLLRSIARRALQRWTYHLPTKSKLEPR